jgi:hypothetical protein
MSGMPPATDASKRRSTPEPSAVSNSSLPTLASSSLLAVTTGLPALSASVMSERLDAADHLDDDVDGGIGHDALGVAGEAARRDRDVALPGQVAHGDPGNLDAHTGPTLDHVGVLVDEPHQRRADVPAAEQADPNGLLRNQIGHHASLALCYSSRRRRSSGVSRRTTTRARPSRTNTTAGRGTLL